MKTTESGQNIAKTKAVRKNANWRHSEAKGYQYIQTRQSYQNIAS